MERRIFVGADHGGYELKEKAKETLRKKGWEVDDYGALDYDMKDDYPDYARLVAQAVRNKKRPGVLFCGSAEGMCIAANKMKGIRAVVAKEPKTAKLAREHNNANVLCLPGGGMRKRLDGVGISAAKAVKLIELFVKTKFSGEARHRRRIRKISRLR